MADFYEIESTFPSAHRVQAWARGFAEDFGVSDELDDVSRLELALEMPVAANDGHYVYDSVDDMAGMFLYAFLEHRPFKSMKMNALVGLLAAHCMLLQNGFDLSCEFQNQEEVNLVLEWINGIRYGTLQRTDYLREFQSCCIPLNS